MNRRVELLDRLADHVLAEGLGGASLRTLAKAAGTSDRMLLYYFTDKAEMMAAVLERIAGRMQQLLAREASPVPLPLAQLQAHLAPILLAKEMWPYMRVWLDIASLSAGGDPLYRQVGEAIGRGFLTWAEAQIDAPTPEARARDAARLLATMEGMVLLTSIGMADVVATASG